MSGSGRILRAYLITPSFFQAVPSPPTSRHFNLLPNFDLVMTIVRFRPVDHATKLSWAVVADVQPDPTSQRS